MIQNFRHRGLERLYEHGDRRHVLQENIPKIERILARLDVASQPGDMNLPGYRLHTLSGNLRGHWGVTVTGNWRIVFRFEEGNVWDVDLVDYH